MFLDNFVCCSFLLALCTCRHCVGPSGPSRVRRGEQLSLPPVCVSSTYDPARHEQALSYCGRNKRVKILLEIISQKNFLLPKVDSKKYIS